MKFVNENDCTIERNQEYAVLMDEDGFVLWQVDKEKWTDDQIWCALRFANTVHEKGFSQGMSCKAKELRTALEYSSNS